MNSVLSIPTCLRSSQPDNQDYSFRSQWTDDSKLVNDKMNLRYDPVEDTKLFKKVFLKEKECVDQCFKNQKFYCHVINEGVLWDIGPKWDILARNLLRKYRIIWRSPADCNPDLEFEESEEGTIYFFRKDEKYNAKDAKIFFCEKNKEDKIKRIMSTITFWDNSKNDKYEFNSRYGNISEEYARTEDGTCTYLPAMFEKALKKQFSANEIAELYRVSTSSRAEKNNPLVSKAISLLKRKAVYLRLLIPYRQGYKFTEFFLDKKIGEIAEYIAMACIDANLEEVKGLPNKQWYSIGVDPDRIGINDKSSIFEFYDLVENTREYKSAEIALQASRWNVGETRNGKYSCTTEWDYMKRSLLEKFGIEWYTPQECNPEKKF